MLYMLDTNICIYILKQRPPAVLDRLIAALVTNNEADFKDYPVSRWKTGW